MNIMPRIKNSKFTETPGARTLFRVFSGLAVLLLVFGFMGCDLAAYPLGVGSLRVSIGADNPGIRSLLPGISMEPAEYLIQGAGPEGESFQAGSFGEDTDVNGLAVGDWVITVSALNVEGFPIGHGEKSVVVKSRTRTDLTIEINPVSGTGSLSLQVVWPVEKVENPRIAAALTNPRGESMSLDFSVGTGEASFSGAGIVTGYYTLSTQLLDGDSVLGGVVDTIRIVADTSTEGTYTFTDINSPTGDLDIAVVIDMEEPLAVELTGVVPVLSLGSTMSAVASVSNGGTSGLTYSWYLNGESFGTGTTLSLGSALRRGHYRLDVVVFTSDGRRSGSATHSFTVE